MSKKANNPSQSTSEEIKDYLRGYGRRGGFADIERMDNSAWQALALQTIAKRQQERAVRLLELFSNEALEALAKGQVELTDQIASVKFQASL